MTTELWLYPWWTKGHVPRSLSGEDLLPIRGEGGQQAALSCQLPRVTPSGMTYVWCPVTERGGEWRAGHFSQTWGSSEDTIHSRTPRQIGLPHGLTALLPNPTSSAFLYSIDPS